MKALLHCAAQDMSEGTVMDWPKYMSALGADFIFSYLTQPVDQFFNIDKYSSK